MHPHLIRPGGTQQYVQPQLRQPSAPGNTGVYAASGGAQQYMYQPETSMSSVYSQHQPVPTQYPPTAYTPKEPAPEDPSHPQHGMYAEQQPTDHSTVPPTSMPSASSSGGTLPARRAKKVLAIRDPNTHEVINSDAQQKASQSKPEEEKAGEASGDQQQKRLSVVSMEGAEPAVASGRDSVGIQPQRTVTPTAQQAPVEQSQPPAATYNQKFYANLQQQNDRVQMPDASYTQEDGSLDVSYGCKFAEFFCFRLSL